MLNNVPCKSPQTASRIIDDQAVVVVPQLGLVRMLNPVGTRVWELCDGKTTVKSMVDCITQEFEVTTTQAADDVVLFLNDLQNKNMVVFKHE